MQLRVSKEVLALPEENGGNVAPMEGDTVEVATLCRVVRMEGADVILDVVEANGIPQEMKAKPAAGTVTEEDMDREMEDAYADLA